MTGWQFSLPELLWLTVGGAVLAFLATLDLPALFWGIPIVLAPFIAWRIENSIGAVVCGTLSALFWTIAMYIPTLWLAGMLTNLQIPFPVTLFGCVALIGAASGYLGAHIDRSSSQKSP